MSEPMAADSKVNADESAVARESTTSQSSVDSAKIYGSSTTPGANGDASRIAEIERITFGYLYRHALEMVNLERGIGFTVFRWFCQPRLAAREFLFADRTRYVKPFTALALAVTLVTFVSFQLFDMNSQMATANAQLAEMPARFRPALALALSFVVQFIHVFLVISLPFQALLNHYWFRHSKWFFPEHMVAVTYMYAIQMLINTCLLPLILINEFLFGLMSTLAAPAYVFWAISQIYGSPWWRTLMAWMGYLLIGAIMPGILAFFLFGVIFLAGRTN